MTEERPLEELAVEAITLCNTWDANPYLKEWNFPKKITTDLAAFALTFAKDPEEYYKKIPGINLLESENNNLQEVFETLSNDTFIRACFSVPQIIQIVKKCRHYYHPANQVVLLPSLKVFYQFFARLGRWMIKSYEGTESYEEKDQLLQIALTFIQNFIK